MKYMGSKNRHAKHILPIMLTDRKENQYWVEPFVGGANIIDKVTGNRIGSDINENVINALINIRDNIKDLPKNNTEFTEEDYKNLQPDYIYYGYAGFAYSYSGKWKGGWCRDKEYKRDYVAESYKNALKQSPLLVNIDFSCVSYDKLSIPPESIIYCDPPYKNTTKYTSSFDHDKFWQWCLCCNCWIPSSHNSFSIDRWFACWNFSYWSCLVRCDDYADRLYARSKQRKVLKIYKEINEANLGRLSFFVLIKNKLLNPVPFISLIHQR